MREKPGAGVLEIMDFFARKAGETESPRFKSPPEQLDNQAYLEQMLSLIAPEHIAKSYAHDLFERYGSLSALFAAEDYELKNELQIPSTVRFFLKGIHEMTARTLREKLHERDLTFDSHKTLINYFAAKTQHDKRESLTVLYLDQKNHLIIDETMHTGTVDHTPFYPREIARRALELSASAIILGHNHPSGTPEPSPGDIEATKQLIAALKPLGIRVHDHIITGRGKSTSLQNLGHMRP